MMEKYKILQQYIDGNMHRSLIFEPTEFGLGVNPDNAKLINFNQRVIKANEGACNSGKQNAQTKIKNI